LWLQTRRPTTRERIKQWIKDQNVQKNSKVSQNTSFHPPPPYCSPLMQTNIWDGKKIIDKYKLPGKGGKSSEDFTPVAEKEVEFKKRTLVEWRALNKARIPVIVEEIYRHYTKRNPQGVVKMEFQTVPAHGSQGLAGEIRMEDNHRRGSKADMEEMYRRDYDEIFDGQSEDLRLNTMIDWKVVKQTWVGFLNPDVYSESVKEFIKAREDGASQQDVFKAMDQAMLEHRLYGTRPEIAYRKHLGLLRRSNTIEHIVPKGGQAK